MRFDTPIFFQTVKTGDYNEKTGNYNADTIVEEKKYADVTESGVDTLKLVYGELKQGSLILRLQQPYKDAFDRIRIGDKLYSVDLSRRQKVFIISEVQ